MASALFLTCSCKDVDGVKSLLSKGLGLSGSKQGSRNIKPSKEDQDSLDNSIRSCPENTTLTGKAYPRGTYQYCAYKDEKSAEIKHGEYRKWHQSGKMALNCYYVHGELEGPYKSFFDSGEVLETSSYLHGSLNGVSTVFNKDGGKVETSTFVEGLKNGAAAKYNKDGSVLEKGSYKNDLKYGLWEFYTNKGILKEKSEFVDDSRHGKTIKYSRDGQPIHQGYYNRNVEIGHWIYFNAKGFKKQEGNYVNGKKHGRWVDYDGNQQEIRNTFYDYGRKLDSYKATNRAGSGGNRSFGKGDILGSEPTYRPPVGQKYRNSGKTPDRPAPLEQKEGWSPL